MGKFYTDEDVANAIPKGHKNAITLDQVVSIFINQGWINDGSCADRVARHMIERAGYEYVICNLQDGHGYFRPTKDDELDFRKWVKQEESRLSKVSKRVCKGRKLLNDFYHERLYEQEIK